MTLDDKVAIVIDQLHDVQAQGVTPTYFTTIIDNYKHVDVLVSRQELENNGVELHPLIKRILTEKGVTDD